MVELSDLFKFKEEISIKHPKTGKVKTKVWVRLLGDWDIKEAYRYSRIASSTKRILLKDEKSSEYQENTNQLKELTRPELYELILAEAENKFISEAPIIVTREEEPKIEEVAAQPDAPQLEELEKLDEKVEDQNKKFLDSINDYVTTKKKELTTELDDLPDEEILNKAIKTLQNIQPLQTFQEELNDQKGFRGTYTDKECKVRGFKDVDDFKNADSSLKSQILNAYNALDMSTDDLKD